MLRDELADSVSKAVSDADRQRILELEKKEVELKVEVSKWVLTAQSFHVSSDLPLGRSVIDGWGNIHTHLVFKKIKTPWHSTEEEMTSQSLPPPPPEM